MLLLAHFAPLIQLQKEIGQDRLSIVERVLICMTVTVPPEEELMYCQGFEAAETPGKPWARR